MNERAQPGTEHLYDLAKLGRPFLENGIKAILSRGKALTAGRFDADDSVVLESWYEALVGRIPAKYWKELSIRAAMRRPYDKFTLGQFIEAWEDMKATGEAEGYLVI